MRMLSVFMSDPRLGSDLRRLRGAPSAPRNCSDRSWSFPLRSRGGHVDGNENIELKAADPAPDPLIEAISTVLVGPS